MFYSNRDLSNWVLWEREGWHKAVFLLYRAWLTHCHRQHFLSIFVRLQLVMLSIQDYGIVVIQRMNSGLYRDKYLIRTRDIKSTSLCGELFNHWTIVTSRVRHWYTTCVYWAVHTICDFEIDRYVHRKKFW